MQIINLLTANHDVDQLNRDFKNSVPAPTLIIDNFLPHEIAKQLSSEIDSIDADLCRKFNRNGSYMEECNDLSIMPAAQPIIAQLHSQTFMNWLSKVTGIQHLLPDPYLIGAGYSRSFNGDSLKNHVDFNWNDSIKLYRKLTLIIYLSEEWHDDWGGHLEFTSFDKHKIKKINIEWNRAVIWQHHEHCLHGYPESINCPKHLSRKTLRLFYYTSDQAPSKEQPAHRSLYWYDNESNTPIDNALHE
jgi:Rps23 Pro-64 3,4-dihydroxylase Tpa1-like proline 4-hydroxylase